MIKSTGEIKNMIQKTFIWLTWGIFAVLGGLITYETNGYFASLIWVIWMSSINLFDIVKVNKKKFDLSER